MQIQVQQLGRTSFNLDVDLMDTVDVLMAKITHKSGVPTAMQMLSFNGKLLEKGRTLQGHNITSSCTIHLVIALGGRGIEVMRRHYSH